MKIIQITMSPSEWAEVHENPIQRDTARRAEFAVTRHLKNTSATHSRVSAASLDGLLYKLDGHTRNLLWEKGLLEAPDKLYVDVYGCESIDQVCELYKQFDNPMAAENSKDKLFGAYRSCGFTPRSTLIKNHGVTTAIKAISSQFKFDIYTEIHNWIGAIKLIDSWDLPPERFSSGVLAAAILSAKIYGNKPREFWVKLANDAGEKTDQGRDGVQALTEVIISYKAAKKLTGGQNIRPVLCKSISCYEAYLNNRLYKVYVKETDLLPYMKKNGVKR